MNACIVMVFVIWMIPHERYCVLQLEMNGLVMCVACDRRAMSYSAPIHMESRATLDYHVYSPLNDCAENQSYAYLHANLIEASLSSAHD